VTSRIMPQVMPCSVPASRAYAEFLAVKPAIIVKKPSSLSFEEAASVPVASQTAWEGLFRHGHLEKGQTILIHGGAGAVGAYAVQLASHAGATVIATASGDDEAYVKSIGASRVINYREEQFEKVLSEKVDMVFDLIGGDTQKRSFLVLKEGGHLVSATQIIRLREQFGNIADSVFSTIYKEGVRTASENRRELSVKSLILNGGQRRDRTADAGLFRAA
jgi:NADPH:quinone reductase-like Zn-dependent oxidoreductase